MLPLWRSKSKWSQFGIAAVFIPLGTSASASTLVIGKELELELELMLGKEIVLIKDYLVQCPYHLNRASTSARASARASACVREIAPGN